MVGAKEHAFSVELKSREHLKAAKIGNDKEEAVFLEGFLGKLVEVRLVEDAMLEVHGANGTLRLDISEAELEALVKGRKERDGDPISASPHALGSRWRRGGALDKYPKPRSGRR